MLNLIGRLAPTLVLAIGLLGGGGIAGGLGWAFTTYIHDPELVRTTRAADELQCTIRTQDAAAAARKDEEARIRAAGDKALQAYLEAVRERDEALQARLDQTEQENADYEKQLAAEGHSCPLTDTDLGFVRK
jgi:hypothetical protein